jgi:lysophospholipase L1-like esterase
MSIRILMITCAVSISSSAFAVNDGVTDIQVAPADAQCAFDGKPLRGVQDPEQATEKELPLSLQPEPRSSEEWWTQRHAEKKAAIAATPEVDVLLLGDSITHSWEGNQAIWNEVLPDHSFFNIGFSGDRTEHVIWRLQDGAVEGLNPRVVMLMIGTNNTGHRMDKPADIAAGIGGVIKELKTRLPKSKLLLLGIFPRGQADDAKDRLNNVAVNKTLKDYADDETVFFLDIGPKFFSEDGALTNGVSGDFLHLSADGYRIWAQSVKPKLDELLK